MKLEKELKKIATYQLKKRTEVNNFINLSREYDFRYIHEKNVVYLVYYIHTFILKIK